MDCFASLAMTNTISNVVPAQCAIAHKEPTHTPRPVVEGCCWTTFAQPCFPSPREAAGRDQGWVALRMPLLVSLPINPPPPTPPRHALTRAEGGEKEANSNFKQPRKKLELSLPGLTRQSILFEKLLAKMDGCPGQARA